MARGHNTYRLKGKKKSTLNNITLGDPGATVLCVPRLQQSLT